MLDFKRMYLYLTVFVSGAAVLVLEVLGTRVISPFYGATIFVWASLITVTLSALALGYFFGGKVADKKPKSLYFYLILGVTGILLPLILKFDQVVLPATDKFGLRLGPLLASILLFSIPLFLLGMVSPFAIRLVTKDKGSSGSSSGQVFAISTIGSVIGGLLAGFFLLPLFSLAQTFIGTGLILVFVAIGGIITSKEKREVIKFLGLGIFLTSVLLPKIQPESEDTFKILYQTQSFFGDIKVVDSAGRQYGRCLYVNGSGQTCIDKVGDTDGFFQRFLKSELQHLAFGGGSKILLMGLGGGGIIRFLPEDARIDIVEIDPEVASVARRYFKFEQKENMVLVIDDARHFLRTADTGQYDLIIENIALGNSVPPHVLTRESWADMKRVLKEDGILLAHLGTHEVNGDNLFNQTVYSTAASLFKYHLTLSSLPNETANLVLYLSDKEIDFNFTGEAKAAKLDFKEDNIVTDNKNPFENYYLSNAISQRENTKTLGNNIFYVK